MAVAVLDKAYRYLCGYQEACEATESFCAGKPISIPVEKSATIEKQSKLARDLIYSSINKWF